MKTSPNVSYKESVHIRDVEKINLTHENGLKRTFSRLRTCKPFWPRDIPLLLLCIKLWSVRGGGTVGVTKCIIPASVSASNSRFERHLNGPKKDRNVYPMVEKWLKTSPNVSYKESVHIRDVAKKLTRVLKIMYYNPRKWPETDIFAKTYLQTIRARRHTPGTVMH
jgi:hypothetical protein